jgi:AcrR family transcriptional regulator
VFAPTQTSAIHAVRANLVFAPTQTSAIHAVRANLVFAPTQTSAIHAVRANLVFARGGYRRVTEEQPMSKPGTEPSEPPRERRDARENRERLLRAAKELFAQQGAEATTMSAIAKAAGVGQGTIYRHFADKGALCHALIKEDINAFEERLGPVLAGTWAIASPLARLDTLIAEKIRLTESHLPLFATMDSPPGARKPRNQRSPFYTWQHERITALLEEAVAAGDLPPLDAAHIADALLAVTAPALYRQQREELGYSSERIAAGVRRLFVSGLHLPAAPSPQQE